MVQNAKEPITLPEGWAWLETSSTRVSKQRLNGLLPEVFTAFAYDTTDAELFKQMESGDNFSDGIRRGVVIEYRWTPAARMTLAEIEGLLAP